MGASCCAAEQNSKAAEIVPQAKIEAQDELTNPVAEPEGLKMVFRMSTSPDSDQKVVYFTCSPLGLSFDSNKMPIVVKNVSEGGEGENLNIQPGMMIEMIGDHDITTISYHQALNLMKEKVGELPKRS